MFRSIFLLSVLLCALGSQISGQTLLKNNRIPNDLLITLKTEVWGWAQEVKITANRSWTSIGGMPRLAVKPIRIPAKTLRSLIAEFERIQFFRFGEDFPPDDGSEMGYSLSDAGTQTISIRINGQTKEVFNDLGEFRKRNLLLKELADKINAAVAAANVSTMKIIPVPKPRKTFVAKDCRYWKAKVDQRAGDVNLELDEKQADVIIEGIQCLLNEEGNRKPGLSFSPAWRSVSQHTPSPTVEVSALYYISYLFYGNYDFADVVALTGIPPRLKKPYDSLVFNSKDDVKTAYESYRKWFEKVKVIGLDEARKKGLDPLLGSTVEWYLQRIPQPLSSGQ